MIMELPINVDVIFEPDEIEIDPDNGNSSM